MKDKTTLSDDDVQELVLLGQMICDSLKCDVNGDKFPCRTDRLSAVEMMKRYLAIHNVKQLDPALFDTDNYLTRIKSFKDMIRRT